MTQMYIYWVSKMIFLPKPKKIQLSRVKSFACRMLSPLCLLVHYLCQPLLGGFQQNSMQGGRVFTFTAGNGFDQPRKDISSKELNPAYMQMHFPFHRIIAESFFFFPDNKGRKELDWDFFSNGHMDNGQGTHVILQKNFYSTSSGFCFVDFWLCFVFLPECFLCCASACQQEFVKYQSSLLPCG